jgi:LysM repeat protein
MPRPYQPPLARPSEGARPARGPEDSWPWKRRLGPLLALVPVLLAVAFGTRMQLGSQSNPIPTPVMTAAGAGAQRPATTPITVAPATGGLSGTAGPPPPTAVATASTSGTSTSSTASGTTAAAPTSSAAVGGPSSGAASVQTGAGSPLGTSSSPTPGTANAAGTSASTSAGAAASTPASSGAFRTYRVQRGDTIKSVADAFGVTPDSVISASGLRNPDSLTVGQVLTIPNQPGYLYRVQPGETLDQIATRAGVPSDRIAAASQLTEASVKPGDVLLIPDSRTPRK